MSMHKAIASGKEHRIEYGTKGQPFCKAVDKTCRNHGGRSGGAANQCDWCLRGRTFKNRKAELISKEKLKEIEDEPNKHI